MQWNTVQQDMSSLGNPWGDGIRGAVGTRGVRIRVLEQRLAFLEAQSQAATAGMNAKEETEGAPAAGAEDPAMADSRGLFNRN